MAEATSSTVGIVDQTDAGVGNTKPVDISKFTLQDATTADRQRMIVGDPDTFDSLAEVRPNGALSVVVKQNEEIIGHLKRIALLLEMSTGHTVKLADVEDR